METQETEKKGTINKRTTSNSGRSSIREIIGTDKMQLSEENASHLIGSIVEKGVSDNPKTQPFSVTFAPKPSILPFPVARHRAHGPHWGPASREDFGEDDNSEDGEDIDSMNFSSVSASANPVQRNQKKGLDLSHWRGLISADDSMEKRGNLKENGFSSKKKGTGGKDKKHIDNADQERMLRDSSLLSRITANEDKDIEIGRMKKTPFADSVVDMESDNSHQLPIMENVKDATGLLNGEARNRDRRVGIAKVEPEVISLLAGREQVSLTAASSSSFNNLVNKQGSGPLFLESEIDAENRARVQGMSHEEIAEAQAEIMEKMSPALVNLLKRRGQEKKRSMTADKIDTVKQFTTEESEPIKQIEVSQNLQHEPPNVTTSSNAKDAKNGKDDSAYYSFESGSGSLWNAWSKRVESIRELRFTLEGSPVDEFEIGDVSNDYNASNVAERDFLRTEGDPGAAGYTIKEAVQLTRSVIPGQRALALHLVASVLDKAILNIQKIEVGHPTKKISQDDKSIDWEAIWAYALGPEPELIFSLRLCLDDNHSSVVLACARVIQCMLSCDLNENFFDISEKIANYDEAVFTAPVFRSKSEINDGFLPGRFWKYSAKPSNISTPVEEAISDNIDEKHTIQDDIVVAGQDVVAGLVKMEILPRLRYLMEADPTTALEEYVISILIAIARHSPTCANAIVKCERLVDTIVHRFAKANILEIHPSGIKSVRLMKVLSQSNKKICIDFVKNGHFQTMTQHLYRYISSLDHWASLGVEYCKLSSALIVEQLRFWRVCIHYGCCISYFPDIFPALCLWLHPPTFSRLHERNVLPDFASVAREGYLVLEALTRKLPNFNQQKSDQHSDELESWSWNYVSPMVDLAIRWIASKSDPYVSVTFEVQEENDISPLLWVYAAVMHMLSTVLEKVNPGVGVNLHGSDCKLPWLPEFVPKVGLEIIENEFLRFYCPDGETHAKKHLANDLFTEKLCHLRQNSKSETALASVCCLHSLVRVVSSIDNLIHLAKNGVSDASPHQHIVSREGKILENGLLKESLGELRCLFNVFTKLVESEWPYVQSIEIFGRGGPAPGVGAGWGATGGGYWSMTVLLAQRDASLLIYMLEIIQPISRMETPTDEEIIVIGHIINSILGVCLITSSRDRDTLEKALNHLLQIPVLRFLNRCVKYFLQLNKLKLFRWDYEDDYHLHFNQTLVSHFKKRWLSVKWKPNANDGNDSSRIQASNKVGVSLETIHEDLETPNTVTGQNQSSISLAVKWAHQRLPLPKHWFLSPVSTISDGRLHCASASPNSLWDPSDVLEVAKTGLFFLLGLEAMFGLLRADCHFPICNVPLVWKLHSLSVILLVGMGVLEDDKSRDVYETLQDFYGQLLDKERSGKNLDLESLRFQSEIHETYSTFIETLVEQFAGISYGDMIFGRQVALYLHRCTEVSVRLAAWNTLANAHVLEILPPLEKCFAEAEGYLEPVEDDENILGAYVKSWISGALDRAATRGSMAFTLALHHLASFIFKSHDNQKMSLRNKLAKSLLLDYSQKQKHEEMILDLIRYQYKTSSSLSLEQQQQDLSLERFNVLREACKRDSTLLREVEKLQSAFKGNR